MPDSKPEEVSNIVPFNFDNTEIAFKHKSNADLKRAYWLFKALGYPFISKRGPKLLTFLINIGLPIKYLIKKTIFKQFCGGEAIEECEDTIKKLALGRVGTILDYSIEGEQEEEVFDATCKEILKTIQKATSDNRIPLTVFKISGVGRIQLLQKLDSKETLSIVELKEFDRVKERVNLICKSAYENHVRVMIDAEESWIQNTIDSLAINMMEVYNQHAVIVYNTYQLYRKDKLKSLLNDIETAKSQKYYFGAKLVRGAYMDKERVRALEMNYLSPIHNTKQQTDRDFDASIEICLENIDVVGFVSGTHNENSCNYLLNLLKIKSISKENQHVYFAQLLGMSDNLSFNLADAGYNVAKYVPYGPVNKVLPYLFRRAEENTSVTGQISRELSLIRNERKRRRF